MLFLPFCKDFLNRRLNVPFVILKMSINLFGFHVQSAYAKYT